MKIDVEGHEVEVLRGAEKTIAAFHPVIIVETGGQKRKAVVSLLERHGYAVRQISFGDLLATWEPGSGS